MAGFGVYRDKVESGEKVNFWFQDRSSNLGVIVPDRGVILDFDDFEVYNQFCEKWPKLAKSYTESTPRGGGRHIFLRTCTPIPPGLVLVPGIEILRLAVVYPSRVNGKSYKVTVPGQIVTSDVLEALQPFIVPGGNKSPAPRIVTIAGRPVPKIGHDNHDVRFVDELKARWPIVEYLTYFEPKLILFGQGRWLSGRCPWHDDHHPSLWIDTTRDTWGCHSCQAHGDVLNWHKLRLGVGIGAAIRDLARYKVEVRG